MSNYGSQGRSQAQPDGGVRSEAERLAYARATAGSIQRHSVKTIVYVQNVSKYDTNRSWIIYFFKVASKLEFRDKALAEIGDEFVKKEARLRKLWQVRLANQIADLPRFDEVYRDVRRSLRVAGLMRG